MRADLVGSGGIHDRSGVRRRSLASVIRVLATVATLLALLASTASAPAVSDPPDRRRPSNARGAFRVNPAMTMNDPTRNPGTIARQLRTLHRAHPARRDDLDHVVLPVVVDHLAGAAGGVPARGRHPRGPRTAVPPGSRGPECPGRASSSPSLIRQGRAHGRRGSWVVWTRGSARGRDSGKVTMHAKVWQFSKVGSTRKVTMIGAYNNGDPPDERAYSAMVTLAKARLYDATQRIFLAVGEGPQHRREPAAPCVRPRVGRLLLPVDADHQGERPGPWNGCAPSPVGPGDQDDHRDVLLAGVPRRLAGAQAGHDGRGGARLTVVVGPDVDASVVRTLRNAGARLEDGCWRTGRRSRPYAYTHDKEMTATWVDGTARPTTPPGSAPTTGATGAVARSRTRSRSASTPSGPTTGSTSCSPQIAHEPDILGPCDPLRSRAEAVLFS